MAQVFSPALGAAGAQSEPGTTKGPVRLFAVLSEADKGDKIIVARVCIVHVRRLGMSRNFVVCSRVSDVLSGAALAGEGVVRLSVRLKGQSIMRAPPSVVAEYVSEGEHPMDVLYSLEYAHQIKVLLHCYKCIY